MATILSRKTATVVLAIALVWLGHAAWRVHNQRAELSGQLQDVEGKVQGMEQQNQFLASSSDYFTSDAYRERQARLKLNYKLSDEQVAFVYRDTGVKEASKSRAVDLSVMPHWKQWLYWLFRR